MSQHDYVIGNDTAANVRADINTALLAIASNNSGASAPATTYANQWWYDSTNDILKIRSEANDAWISVASLNQTSKQFFPIVGGVAVTATGTEMNYLVGVTSLIQTQLGLKAALASPALTGTPTAPTASFGTNTTQVATTAYADARGFKNIPAVGTKTSSYTLATGDVGKYVQLGASGAIVIPDATFAEGDAIVLFNNTTGNITITCTITTAYIGGTDADKATVTLATRGVANIFFISGTVCVITGNIS